MTVTTNTIVRSSLRDQVLAELRQRLVSGRLEPGKIYSAQAVAAELGVSGSPVREAMLTLVNQDLMAPVRNRGFMVVEISEQDRVDILEMRLWLEVPAMAKLASEPDRVRADEQKLRDIAAGIVTAAETRDVVAFLDQDREFHLGLTARLGNSILTDTVGHLRDRTRLYGLDALSERGSLVSSAKEHLGILEAIASGSVADTERMMTAHLQHVLGDWAGRNGTAGPR